MQGNLLGKGGHLSEYKLILLAVVGYILIQAAFAPGMYVSIDEHTYIKNAFLLREGKIAQQDPGYACRSTLYTEKGYVASQFIGRSLFLLPFTFLGLLGIMFSGLAIHLINFFGIVLVLRRMGANALFSLLYLFYPAFILNSRSVSPELLVLTGFIFGLYFYLGNRARSWLFSGFFFGLAALARYDAIFGLGAFAAASLLSNRKRAAMLLLGALPVGIAILSFNGWAYGGTLATGHGSGLGLAGRLLTEGIIDVDNLIYPLLLLIFYPLLIASPFLAKKFPLKGEFLLLIAVYLVLNSTFTSFLDFNFSVQTTFTARLRYLVPLLGLLMIPYAQFLSEKIGELRLANFRLGPFGIRDLQKHRSALLCALVIVMLGLSAFASAKHAALSDSRVAVLEEISSQIPQGSTVIGSSDDCIYFQKNLFGDRKYYNIDIAWDIAGNPQGITLDSLKGPATYVIAVNYSYLEGKTGPRQQIVVDERRQVADFIDGHTGSLTPVWGGEGKTVRIYKWE